jgi:hypothetical protein
MKALYCKNCKDLFNIKFKLKKCSCGKTKGKYINWHSAIYSGKYAVPIGIENPSFSKAMLDIKMYEFLEKEDMITAHSHFVAYVILESNLTFFKEEDLKKIQISKNDNKISKKIQT